MRSIWTGAITFGLVNVPVRLVSAVKARELSFDLLSKKDLSPVHYKRVSEATGREVAYQDIVKGYQYAKGKYVVVTPQDFANASPSKSDSIDIVEFVDQSEIDPVYYDRAYYLVPGKGADRTYHLLWKALIKSHTVGVAEFILRNRARVVVLRARPDGALMIHQLHYEGEIDKTPDGIPKSAAVSAKELDLAVKLVQQLQETFDPADFKDTYTAKLKKVITAKAKGKTVVVAEKKTQPHGKVIDLMEELRKSLEAPRRNAAKTATTKTAPTKTSRKKSA